MGYAAGRRLSAARLKMIYDMIANYAVNFNKQLMASCHFRIFAS